MNNSQANLLEIVNEQKKTIEKYSQKLKDIVAAHKSLIIEKKALEDTIKILNVPKANEKECSSNEEHKTDLKSASENELKTQLSSLLASFSNLVSEKSRMEECFKSNQKQLLCEKEEVETQCKELREEVKLLSKHLKLMESKNLNELTKKDFKKSQEEVKKGKCKVLDKELLAVQVKNYEKEIVSLRSELEAKQLIYDFSEKKLKESALEFNRLQDEIRNLQIEHEMAIQNEKEKTKNVENHAKKLTAAQEERVANLETRLAELSEIIGSYERLRFQDQIEIQKLKEHIALIDVGQSGLITEKKLEVKEIIDYESLKAQFLEIKDQLQKIAGKSDKEEDLKNLFLENLINEDIHLTCKEECNKIKAELEYYKNEVKSNNKCKSGKEILILQNQVKNLQEKIRILTNKNKETQKDYELQIEQLKKAMKNEKSRYKEMISASESDHKARVWLLEEQLQKQRERSLALLEEKEQEIQALQSTFQMFLPGRTEKPEDESNVLAKTQFTDGPHIVHYANELARKDIEISGLRRSKHQIEMTLRDLQKEVASVMEKHREEKQSLHNEIMRLERCQTREGANMEYLKNVVYNFLLSSDAKSKRHMCNAIAAVLKFTETELQKVIDHNKNIWQT